MSKLQKTKQSRGYKAVPWLLLAPSIVLFLFIFVIPIIYTVYQSLYTQGATSGTGFGGSVEASFTGLEQYRRTFADSEFLWSIVRIFIIGLIQVPVMLMFALCLALMLDSVRCFGRKAFNLLYFLPYAVPGVVSALMWAYLVQPSLSPFTMLAKQIGWNLDLTTPTMIPWTIGNMIVWAYTGYNMVIMYAALKALPTDIMEAARMDGATPWQIAWKIKVPMIRPAVIMTAIFSIIGTLQMFNEPVVLRNATPNVIQTFSPVMDVYFLIQRNDFNGAAARSIVLALVTFALSFSVLKIQQRKEARG